MKKILVPTDFSACAANALKYAAELAARAEAELTVLHVIYPNDGMNNNMYDAFWVDDYVQQRMEDTSTWSQKILEDSGFKDVVPLTTHCNIGFPAGTIVDTAEDLKVALVVMGTTGATGLKGILMGSTAGGVIAKGECPVLTIPPEASFTEGRSFVLATDMSLNLNKATIDAVHLVLNAHRAALNVLHVLREDEALNHQFEKGVGASLGTIPHHFHYLHSNNVTTAVDHFIQSTDAAGVIAVSHHHSALHQLFYRSVSRSLAERVQVPALVIQDKK